MAQSHAVDALGAPHVRGAVTRDRDGFIGRQAARHARHPQHFVITLRLQHAVDELVHPGEFAQRRLDAKVRASHDFNLGFAEIGGDMRIGQGRTQSRRMWRQGQRAVRLRTQAFLLDTASHAQQSLDRERVEPLLQIAHFFIPSFFSGLQGSTGTFWLLAARFKPHFIQASTVCSHLPRSSISSMQTECSMP